MAKLLLAGLLSLLAPVVAVTVTPVGPVSVPPATPGAVKLMGQVMLLPAASAATGSVGVQVPTATGIAAPSLSCAVALQVGASAVPATAMHRISPLTVLPGLTTLGRPDITTPMSAGGALTVVGTEHPAGAGAQLLPAGGVMVFVMTVPGATPASTATRSASVTLSPAGTANGAAFRHCPPVQTKSPST